MNENKIIIEQPNIKGIKLIGKWQMVCWKANTAKGWEKLDCFSDNHFTWDFMDDGTLIESIVGQEPTKTEYYYYPDENMLAIDRSDYADDGYLLDCIEEHYRIEFLSDRYMLLYDLEDVKVEPDDYTLMMELEKI